MKGEPKSPSTPSIDGAWSVRAFTQARERELKQLAGQRGLPQPFIASFTLETL